MRTRPACSDGFGASMDSYLSALPSGLTWWEDIAGSPWAQRADYPHRKHTVSLPKAAPANTPTPTAAPTPSPTPSASGSLACLNSLLKASLTEIEPVSSLYSEENKKRAIEHYREALIAFVSTPEVGALFGPTKSQAILKGLSGPIYRPCENLPRVAELLSFVLDAEVIIGTQGFHWLPQTKRRGLPSPPRKLVLFKHTTI